MFQKINISIRIKEFRGTAKTEKDLVDWEMIGCSGVPHGKVTFEGGFEVCA